MTHAADLRARRARRLSLALLLLVLVAVSATSDALAPTASAPVLDESALVQLTLDGSSPNELFGFIERATVGFRVRPDPGGIELEALLGGGTVPLVPTGDGGYRHAREGGTSIRLTTDAEGRRIVAGGMAYFEAGPYAWARARLLALQGALALIQLAPLWALGWALVAGIRRLRGRALASGEFALHAWPAAAGLAFMATPILLLQVVRREVFTVATPLSIGLCVCTLVFAACSAAAVAEAVRAAVGRSLPLATRLVPSAAACACFGMTLYLLWHGIIGLRIWDW